jgi:hypothetical protein
MYAPRTLPEGSLRMWQPFTSHRQRVIDRVEQGHCSREKCLLTQSIAPRLTDPRVRTQFFFKPTLKQWG